MTQEVKPEAAVVKETTPSPVLDKPRAARLQELEDAWRKNSVVEEAPAKVEVKEEPVKEEVVAEVKAEPAKEGTDDFTRRFAQLTKMEQQLKKREAELKSRETELEEAKKFRELKQLAKTDPMRFAQETGLKLADLAEQTFKPKEYSEKARADELAERLKKLEEMNQKAQEESELKVQQENARKYVKTIESNIEAAGDKYQLIRELGAQQLVINTIATYYQQSGEEMEWSRAADLTEEYLLQEKLKELEKLTKLEKIKTKFNLATKPETKPEPTKQTSPVKTISNQMASAPATREAGKPSREERERRIKELAADLFTE